MGGEETQTERKKWLMMKGRKKNKEEKEDLWLREKQKEFKGEKS